MRGSLGNLGNKISLKRPFCLLQTWNDFKENCWGSAWPTDALPGALMYWEGTELCLSNQEQVWQNWYWPAAGAFRKLWLLILSPPTPHPRFPQHGAIVTSREASVCLQGNVLEIPCAPLWHCVINLLLTWSHCTVAPIDFASFLPWK